MNKNIIALLLLLCTLVSCSDFLDLKPQGLENSENYMNTEENAIRAVNGIYDLLGQSEGKAPDGRWLAHHYEFFMGSMITDDSEKGSKMSDGADIIALLDGSINPSTAICEAFWIHGFWGVSRSNYVLKNLPNSPIDESLKKRLLGEAYFLRGYHYFYLLKHFGGVPLFEEPVQPSQYGKVPRATLHETFAQVEKDLRKAIELLPERSEYANSDLGRATCGAARGYLARVLMYQLGVDAECDKSWQDVFDQTSQIIESGEYQLSANFASLFEADNENCEESIFEVQSLEGNVYDAPASLGTAYHYFQANRVENKGANSGYGFNNPTENLVKAFDPTDPRLSCTVYGEGYNGGILYGLRLKYDRTQQGSNYFNRKAALAEKPNISKSSARNVLLMRLGEIYLMHAEACYYLNDEDQARLYLNKIRERARKSTLCRGYNEGDANGYVEPVAVPNVKDITYNGEQLLEAIWTERRLELAMENLRGWDLIRTGRFLDISSKVKDLDRVNNGNTDETRYPGYKENFIKHCIQGKGGLHIPVLPIPLSEVQSWGLVQNPY